MVMGFKGMGEKNMPPQRIDKKQTKIFTPIKIYLDELNEIEGLLIQHGDDLELSTEDFQYDSVQELVGHVGEATPTITKLTIRSNSHPTVILSLLPNTASLEVGSSDVASTGIFYKLSAILNKCQVPFASVIPLYILAVLLLVIIIDVFWHRGGTVPAILVTGSISIIILSIAAIYGIRHRQQNYSQRYSQIILKKRHEDKSFWQKNKGDIIKGIIIAAVSAIMTLLLKSLVEK
jgi:hypothetical protein